MAGQAQATEHPDSPENRRGSSHRNVSPAVNKGIDEIATGAGQQNQSRSEPRPQHAGQDTEKQRDTDRIAQDMREVGMKVEGGDDSPKLTAEYSVRIRAATFEPRQGGLPFRDEKKQ
jgi:hypothetical protein